MSGHLATVTSREEKDWIAQNTDSGSGDLWIGGIQKSNNDGPDSDWRWVTGEQWSFTNWSAGEPNDDPDDERFLEIDTSGGEWNDLNGGNGGFVVEFPFSDPVASVRQLVPPRFGDDRFTECVIELLGEERIREIAAAGSEPDEEEERLIRLKCEEPVAFQPDGEAIVYNVAALIDGVSYLIIKGDEVQWFHTENAAPGRHGFANEPTVINGTEWIPEWPDEPDAENRNCQCFSSELEDAIPELPEDDVDVRIEVHQARGDVSFSEEDERTLVIKFDDHPSSSDWYEVSIIIEPAGSRRAARAVSNFGMTRGATISGTVTDEDTGLPIAGIKMRAHPVSEDRREASDTETDFEGRYTLRGLAPGAYVVRTRDYQRGYILEFFNDSPKFDLADPITVDGADAIDGIDFQLKLGAIISGRVIDADTGDPIADANIYASLIDGRGNAWTNTDSGGRYTLPGVPSGAVDIRVQAHGYIEEHLRLRVEGAERLTGADIELGTGASISGRVVDAETGVPISRVHVRVETNNGDCCNGSDTDFDGRYEIAGLAPGTYFVKAEGGRGGYMGVFYGGALDWDGATPVTVTRTSPATGIDFQLELGTSITGRVVDAETGQPVSRVHVFADANTGRGGGNGSDTDFDGRYEISGLAPGTYFVKAEGERRGYMRVYYGGALGWNGATPVTVTRTSPATGIDFQLDTGTSITGRVVDAETGQPVAGAEVYAGPEDQGQMSWSRTDGEGRYVLRGLPTGVMELGARGLDYIEKRLTVVTGDSGPSTAPDFRMELGATISGTVTDEDTGLPIVNANIEANADGAFNSWADTDSEGRYVIRGLAPGSYGIKARAEREGYIEELWHDTFNWDDARKITIKGKETFEGIDFELAMGASISGKIVDAETGSPISNMEVHAGPVDNNHLAWTRTDGQGNYVLRGLPDGRIEVVAFGQGYVEVRQTVTIQGGADLTNVDF